MKNYNILIIASKTCPETLAKSSRKSKIDQKTLGFFVLLTATFAFISGYYALTTIFGDWDPIQSRYYLYQNQQIIVTVIALLYALMILMIDREIVSAKSKLAVLYRLPLAIIVGVVIAVPLKMKVFEDRINQQIYANQTAQISPFLETRNAFINQLEEEIREIEMQITYHVHEANEARARARDEDLGRSGQGLTGRSGQGQFYRYAKEEERSHDNEILRLEGLREERISYRETRLSEMDNEMYIQKIEPVFGLWERFIVMTQIVREDETGKARQMVLGISILFILFELIPSLIKLLNSRNDYDKLLDFYDKRVDQKLDYLLNNNGQPAFYDETTFVTIPEIRMEVMAN